MPVVSNLHPDLGDIAERVDNGQRLAPVLLLPVHDDDNPPIDAVARERAEEQIAELHGRVAEAEALLAYLSGFIGERGPGAAAINSSGIKLGEVREQLPVLRQAVQDMESDS